MTRLSIKARNAMAAETQAGLAGWLLESFGSPFRKRFPSFGKLRPERRMRLVEVLALGGKRQLMLVECDGQRYLVGGGGDTVQSISAMEQRSAIGTTEEPARTDIHAESLRALIKISCGEFECGI